MKKILSLILVMIAVALPVIAQDSSSHSSTRRVSIESSRSSRPVGEGWWACTTRVYRTAKQACNGDSQCDFLCDLVDLAGGCTISMAAAAAIACV